MSEKYLTSANAELLNDILASNSYEALCNAGYSIFIRATNPTHKGMPRLAVYKSIT